MKNAAWIIVTCIVTVGCQRITETDREDSDSPGVIQAKNGDLYSVDCLRQNASLISEQGAVAMEGCKVTLTLLPGELRGTYRPSPDYIVYYPPTYYSPVYQSNSTNSFCNYAFGSGWYNNCFSLFGYDYSYSNNFSSSCSPCLFGNRPRSCRNSCYSTHYVWGY